MVAITSIGAPSVPPLIVPTPSDNPAPAKDKAASPETKPAAAPASPTLYAQNRDRFMQLVNTVVNADGKASLDDQIKAFTTYDELWVRDQLTGSDTEMAELCTLSDKIYDSDFGQRLKQVGDRVGNFVISAHEGGERIGVAHLQAFASLSEDDQKIYYTAQNGFNYSGRHIYGDFDSYRDLLAKQAIEYAEYKNYKPGLASALLGLDSVQLGSGWSAKVLSAYRDQASGGVDTTKAKSGTGQDTQTSADQSADSDTAQALKILSEPRSDWDKQVLSLFKDTAEKDPQSKDDKDRPRPSWLASLPDSYKPGNLMDRVA